MTANPAGEGGMCASPGLHGSNMDSKLIKKGAKVYFPVHVPGALLQKHKIPMSKLTGEDYKNMGIKQ